MQQDKEIEASGDLLDKAYIYLTEGRYPNGCKGNEKRVIRRKAAKFVTRDGELLYKKTVRRLGGKKVCIFIQILRVFSITHFTADGGTDPVYIRTRDEQIRILRACHSDPTSGHLGFRRTLARINERFVWKGIVKDCQEMVSSA